MIQIDDIKSFLAKNEVDFEIAEESNKKQNSYICRFDTDYGTGLYTWKNNEIIYFILNLGLVNWAEKEDFDEKFINNDLEIWIRADHDMFLNYLIGNKVDCSKNKK